MALSCSPPVVESEFGLLQVQIRGGSRDPIELCEPGLGKRAEGLHAVNMVSSFAEWALAVMVAIMLLAAQVHQAIIGLLRTSDWIALLGSGLPLVMACRMTLAQRGTIQV